MGNRTSTNGLIALGAGFLAASVSSLLGHFTILGTATGFAMGLLDGISVVAFCVAIFVLVRSRRTTQE
jgi:hypothetical protein